MFSSLLHFVIEKKLGALKKEFPAHEEILDLVRQNACGEGSPVMASNVFRLFPLQGKHVQAPHFATRC